MNEYLYIHSANYKNIDFVVSGLAIHTYKSLHKHFI